MKIIAEVEIEVPEVYRLSEGDLSLPYWDLIERAQLHINQGQGRVVHVRPAPLERVTVDD